MGESQEGKPEGGGKDGIPIFSKPKVRRVKQGRC